MRTPRPLDVARGRRNVINVALLPPQVRCWTGDAPWAAHIVLGAYAVFVSFFLLAADDRYIAQLFREDDGYFFMTIARNIARGLGPTFDKIHITNGFHPLWMAD